MVVMQWTGMHVKLVMLELGEGGGFYAADLAAVRDSTCPLLKGGLRTGWVPILSDGLPTW